MDLAGEKKKRDQRLKEKGDRIAVQGSVAPQATAPKANDEKKPKEETRAAKGASAKRLKDESLSELSSGTE